MVDVRLAIPPEIAAGIAAGQLVRNGSVVRTLAGQFFAFLDEVDGPTSSPAAAEAVAAVKKSSAAGSSAADRALALSRANPVTAGGVGIAAAVTVGAVALAGREARRRKAASDESIRRFWSALQHYVVQTGDGSVTGVVIDDLQAAWSAVQSLPGKRLREVITNPNLLMLMQPIADYTRDLAAANDTELPIDFSRNPQVVDLQKYLEQQRQILDGLGDTA